MSRLLNRYEELTYKALTRVCASNGAHVFVKVRVADVLPIEGSGIDTAHYSYALRAHFDFLVTNNDYQPQFSVEYDGPLHSTSDVQRQRDVLKNELCDRFEHPLLRINSRYINAEYRGLDLLTYFVDAWFYALDFERAQQEGTVPYDEICDINSVVYTDMGGRGTSRPYWLSLDIQLKIQNLHKAGRIQHGVPSHYVGADQDGNYRCMSWLPVTTTSVVFVVTGMKAQRFRGVWISELVAMLALFDLYPKIEEALSGTSAHLVERTRFFDRHLTPFRQRFQMLSSLSVGA